VGFGAFQVLYVEMCFIVNKVRFF